MSSFSAATATTAAAAPAAAAAGPVSTGATPNGDHRAMSERIDAAIDRAIEEGRIAGTVVQVAHRGELAYTRAAGYAEREAREPMRIESRFRLASLTKPIVALAVLSLVEQGVLALDEPVTTWLPHFTPRLSDGADAQITLHHLLTHTAGLDYGFHTAPDADDGVYHRLGISDGLDLVDFDLEENLRRIARAPLGFAPGTGHRYSVAYDVLGAVIERALQTPLPVAIERLVTQPLGLRDTGFSVPPGTPLVVPYVDARPQPARMHGDTAARLPEGIGHCVRFSPERAFSRAAFPSGGAGMIGTAPDMLTLFESIRARNGSIVASDTIDLMMAPHVGAQAQTLGPGWGFGYGWAVLVDPIPTATAQSAGTIQWGGLYGHSWFIDPKAELTVVALTNVAFEGMCGRYVSDLCTAIYDACAASSAR